MAQPTPTLKKGPEPFAWPFYGYTQNHTRFFPAPETVRPPFKKLWVHNAGALLEFPPVIYGDRIFQLADNADAARRRHEDGPHDLDATGSASCRPRPPRSPPTPCTSRC